MSNYPDGMRPGEENLPDPVCSKCEAKLTDDEIDFCEGCIEWAREVDDKEVEDL